MKQQFIETGNTQKFADICNELMSPSSLIGPSLAMVTGPAGRGKTEAARHYSVHHGGIYISPMITRTPAMLLREICFELSGMRPARTDGCLNVIGEAMSQKRQLLIIDESDLLELRSLEMLRNCNELFACPIVFLGEDSLKRKIGTRRTYEIGNVLLVDRAEFQTPAQQTCFPLFIGIQMVIGGRY